MGGKNKAVRPLHIAKSVQWLADGAEVKLTGVKVEVCMGGFRLPLCEFPTGCDLRVLRRWRWGREGAPQPLSFNTKTDRVQSQVF